MATASDAASRPRAARAPREDASKTLVLVLCGLPGVGKTTLARALARRARESGHDAHHARYDARELRAMTREDGTTAFEPARWRAARAEAAADVDAATRRGNAREDGVKTVVIVDDNMYYRGMRWEVFRAAREARASCACAHVTAPTNEARRRNRSREGAEAVPEEVFERMTRAFEAPAVTTPGDGATFPAFVVDATGETDVDAAWSRALEFWGPAPDVPASEAERELEREAARAETAKSALHALDVRARASVSRVVADAADARRAAVAAAANEARRALLRDARALDGSRDDVFEEMAMLEGAFAQTLSDL